MSGIAANWVIVRFLRFYMWIKRARGIACRGCGMPIAPELARALVEDGCIKCQSRKLTLIL